MTYDLNETESNPINPSKLFHEGRKRGRRRTRKFFGSIPSRKSPRSLVQLQRPPPPKIDLRSCARRGRGRRGGRGTMSRGQPPRETYLRSDHIENPIRYDYNDLENESESPTSIVVDPFDSPILPEVAPIVVRPRRGRGSRGGKMAPISLHPRKPRGRPSLRQTFSSPSHEQSIEMTIQRVSGAFLELEKSYDADGDYVATDPRQRRSSLPTSTPMGNESVAPSSNDIHWRKRKCEQLQQLNHEQQKTPTTTMLQQQNVEDEGSEEELQWSLIHTTKNVIPNVDDDGDNNKLHLVSKHDSTPTTPTTINVDDATNFVIQNIQSVNIKTSPKPLDNNSSERKSPVSKVDNGVQSYTQPSQSITESPSSRIRTNIENKNFVESNHRPRSSPDSDHLVIAEGVKHRRSCSVPIKSVDDDRLIEQSKLMIVDEIDAEPAQKMFHNDSKCVHEEVDKKFLTAQNLISDTKANIIVKDELECVLLPKLEDLINSDLINETRRNSIPSKTEPIHFQIVDDAIAMTGNLIKFCNVDLVFFFQKALTQFFSFFLRIFIKKCFYI